MNEHEAPDTDGVEIVRPPRQTGAHDDAFPAAAVDDANAEPRSGEVPAAPADAEPRRHARTKQVIGFGAAAVVLLGIGAGGGALAVDRLHAPQQETAATGSTNGFGRTGSGPLGGSDGLLPGAGSSDGSSGGFGWQGGDGFGSSRSQGVGPQGWAPDTGSATTATAAQQTGVVTIVSTLGYASGEAAGTGIVLTSSGEILTNNHVIEGSTSIRVTVESTGRTYAATVVGDDPADDVAVLQLRNASGLTPARIAGTAATVGDAVTAVGNAGGTGTLSAASGTVTDLDQSITTQAEGSAASESLTGLIETDADIVAGDSGGPLENGSGAVVGIDTAASAGTADPTGYAIPIAKAVRIAGQITSGSTADGITLGRPAFLGVEVSGRSRVEGAGVAQVIDGTPAASAGLEAGDVITGVDGSAVGSAADLTTLLHAHRPGETVTLAVTDTTGASHSVQVTLIAGPAD